METLTENEIADIKDYADELETELNHRTLQWEGVKDMLGTAQAELAEVKAENERLRKEIRTEISYHSGTNTQYRATRLQAVLAKRVEGE